MSFDWHVSITVVPLSNSVLDLMSDAHVIFAAGLPTNPQNRGGLSVCSGESLGMQREKPLCENSDILKTPIEGFVSETFLLSTWALSMLSPISMVRIKCCQELTSHQDFLRTLEFWAWPVSSIRHMLVVAEESGLKTWQGRWENGICPDDCIYIPALWLESGLNVWWMWIVREEIQFWLLDFNEDEKRTRLLGMLTSVSPLSASLPWGGEGGCPPHDGQDRRNVKRRIVSCFSQPLPGGEMQQMEAGREGLPVQKWQHQTQINNCSKQNRIEGVRNKMEGWGGLFLKKSIEKNSGKEKYDNFKPCN